MAVALEFIDVIVPIRVIEQKYPGGFDGLLSNFADSIGRAMWHDDHLFRTGAMSPRDAETIVRVLESLRFRRFAHRDGRQVWRDLCVVEVLFGGATLPCDWLEVCTRERIAYLKGKPRGPIAGPHLR